MTKWHVLKHLVDTQKQAKCNRNGTNTETASTCRNDKRFPTCVRRFHLSSVVAVPLQLPQIAARAQLQASVPRASQEKINHAGNVRAPACRLRDRYQRLRARMREGGGKRGYGGWGRQMQSISIRKPSWGNDVWNEVNWEVKLTKGWICSNHQNFFFRQTNV